MLSVLARAFADSVAVYLWFWTSNLDPHLLRTPAFWTGIVDSAPSLLLAALTLCLCAWSSATLATRLSRPAALFFAATLLLTGIIGPPTFLSAHLSLVRARDFPGNAAVFTGLFYRDLFPALMQILAVLAPALHAIRPPRTETAQ